MAGEWMVEEREYGWFGRLISPVGGGRPGTGAVVLGAAAVAAFGLSLSLDWASITATPQSADQQAATTATVIHASPGNMYSLDLVYMVGVLALLGLVGAAVTRPDLALRLRLAASGVTAGLVAVVVGATVRLPESAISSLSAEYDAKAAIEVGLFFGYAAAVLPLASIWVAARPAERARMAATEAVEAPDPEIGEAEERPVPLPRGLSVSGGPVDLTVTPG